MPKQLWSRDSWGFESGVKDISFSDESPFTDRLKPGCDFTTGLFVLSESLRGSQVGESNYFDLTRFFFPLPDSRAGVSFS